ncbi:MAG: hypothetical protein ACK5N0_04040 [Synechococcaceae cyanobacterium]
MNSKHEDLSIHGPQIEGIGESRCHKPSHQLLSTGKRCWINPDPVGAAVDPHSPPRPRLAPQPQLMHHVIAVVMPQRHLEAERVVAGWIAQLVFSGKRADKPSLQRHLF